MSFLLSVLFSGSVALGATVKPCASNLKGEFPILADSNISLMEGWVNNHKISVEPNCKLQGSAYLIRKGSDFQKLTGDPSTVFSSDEVAGSTSGAFDLNPKWKIKDDSKVLIILGDPPKNLKINLIESEKTEPTICKKKYPKARLNEFALNFEPQKLRYYHAFAEIKPGLECEEYFGKIYLDGSCQEMGKRTGDCEAHYSDTDTFATEVVAGLQIQRGGGKEDFLWLKQTGWEGGRTFIVPLK